MKRKIEKYIDNLFDNIYETSQLRELKEEMASNLLDKINDFIASGDSQEKAFKKGIASLGNVAELVSNLKKSSQEKFHRDHFSPKPLGKKHVLGYMVASTILLLGLVIAGIVYSQNENLLFAARIFFTSTVVSVALFVYFGLTQETAYGYGMKAKRALAYSLASGATLAGIFIPLILYLNENKIFDVLVTLMIICIPAIIAFIYLGLTEKSRDKITAMDEEWQKQWLEYYNNPQSEKVKDTVSGAIWIFATAIFLIGLFTRWQYSKFSWIIFLFAAGVQVLLEAYFQSRRRR